MIEGNVVMAFLIGLALAALAVLLIGAGFFFHIGWNLYHPG